MQIDQMSNEPTDKRCGWQQNAELYVALDLYPLALC
jgi:hypothetical protein